MRRGKEEKNGVSQEHAKVSPRKGENSLAMDKVDSKRREEMARNQETVKEERDMGQDKEAKNGGSVAYFTWESSSCALKPVP